jgi:hypothetical protein
MNCCVSKRLAAGNLAAGPFSCGRHTMGCAGRAGRLLAPNYVRYSFVQSFIRARNPLVSQREPVAAGSPVSTSRLAHPDWRRELRARVIFAATEFGGIAFADPMPLSKRKVRSRSRCAAAAHVLATIPA